jgi:DNA-binding PadR family transcriptional regulator
MQVRDNDTQLLYGLFQGICTWALERGYKDISGMKNLLKLAMVDTCWKRHADKSSFAAQMAIVTDLGISLRNVQYTLKALEDLQDLSSDLVKIREIQKEIVIILLREEQTLEGILAEVCYLIHAPHDLQKRTLHTILADMEQKGIIVSYEENDVKYYRTAETHVNLFDGTDLSARVSGLLTHIDAFNHTVGDPLFKVVKAHPDRARDLQQAINEFLRGTGNAFEHECRECEEITKPFYFYLGSSPLQGSARTVTISDALLGCIQTRFQDPDSASILRNHWYQLTPAKAQAVYDEVCAFALRECETADYFSDERGAIPFSLYFGLADRHIVQSGEEI